MQRGQALTAKWGQPTMRRCVTAPRGRQAAANTTLAGAAPDPRSFIPSGVQTHT
jgi:hypothetical protein